MQPHNGGAYCCFSKKKKRARISEQNGLFLYNKCPCEIVCECTLCHCTFLYRLIVNCGMPVRTVDERMLSCHYSSYCEVNN